MPDEPFDVGDRVTQDDIEEAFDTGFGYQISGINPRRDENDNRYILLFANENGPYDDSVRSGRFTYDGEGLSGDQSKSSPGNSVLISSITEPIPVFFFYKGENFGAEWEYRGLIKVLDYEHVSKGGRKVLEFEMDHA